MESLLRFYALAARLKKLDRAGWRRAGVAECESVAEHTFGVALLAMFLPLEGVAGDGARIDRDRCIKLALVHDLAESIVGDITPHDRIDPAEKHQREEAAIRDLANTLGDAELVELWSEFEANQTPEAQLVRDLDVIEMAWQARSYENEQSMSRLIADEFVASARGRITTAAGRALLDAILAQ